jgi:hypothetical protein
MTLYLDLVFKYQVCLVGDNEVLIDSEEIKSKPDLKKYQMKRKLTGLGDKCCEKTRS